MTEPVRRNPVRTRIRRWAARLPDDVVTVAILLLGLTLTCLVMAGITLVLLQLLRLAEGDENGILVIEAVILALGVALALPAIVGFAYLLQLLEGLVGVQCPSCRQRELVWRSGTWKYGDPPAYQYFQCTSCGAEFRQLCGGQGVLSDLERVEERPRGGQAATNR